MNEIKLSTPAVAYEPAKVLYDFTELDSEIAEIEKRYKCWLPSEEEIKDAEKVAKDINGVAKNLNDEKVRIKKEMNAESKQFEDEAMSRVNKLKGIRQSVLDSLDVYEQERIKTRTEEFKKYVEEYCEEIDFEVPYSVVFESKVTNKSCTEKQFKELAKANIDGHKLNFDLLCQMDVEDKELLQSIYMQKWDRMQAIDEYNSQMEAKKRAEELRKQREVEKLVASIRKDEPIAEFKETVISKNATYMISVSGNVNCIEDSIKRMRNLGLKVEVL